MLLDRPRVLTIVFLLAMLAACTSYTAGDVPDFVFSGRALRIEQGDVVVGADPFFDSDRIEDTFDVDMSRAGYFPVHLRIANNSGQRIVLLRQNISMVDSHGSVHPSISSDAVFDELRHNSTAYGILGFGVFSFWSAESANAAMRTDWAAKEISPSILLGKGDARTGFVFFRLPPEVSPQSTALRLTVTDFHGQSERALTGAFSAPAIRPETETVPRR